MFSSNVLPLARVTTHTGHKEECFDETEEECSEIRAWRQKYTQVCELINNAAAAIMYILGGQSDCRYQVGAIGSAGQREGKH